MRKRRWRVVKLRDVAREDDLAEPADGVTPHEREAARAELRDDADALLELPDYPRVAPNWRNVRRFLGITAFGVATNEAAAGEALIFPHHEKAYGHEELYLVVEGCARFLLDDEEVEVATGEIVYAGPEVGRGAIALETPTVLFMVGGIPGSYEPPIWASDWRPPDEWLASHRRG
jgi:mannose-6-phosphate isomerase-like protein (cupin superfamily)